MIYRPGRRRRLILAISLALVAAVVAGGLIWVNLVAFPRVVARVKAQAATRGVTLDTGRAWYLPVTGLVIRDITVQTGAPASDPAVASTNAPAPNAATPNAAAASGSEGDSRAGLLLRITRLRTGIPSGALRYMRSGWAGNEITLRGGSDSARHSGELPLFDEILGILSGTARSGLLPRRIVARDAAITLATGSLTVSMTSRRLSVDSHTRSGLVTATSEGTGDDLRGWVRIDYGNGVVETSIEPTRFSAGPFSSVRLGGSLLVERAGGAGSDSSEVVAEAADGAGSPGSDEPADLAFSGNVRATDVVFDLPALAETAVRAAEIGYRFAGTLDREGGKVASLTFTRGDLSVNRVPLSFEPTILGEPRNPRLVRIGIHLAPTSIPQLANATPQALLGPLSGLQIDGTLAWDLDLSVPLDASSEVEWDSHATVSDLVVTAIPAAVNVYELNDAFVHTIADDEVGFRRTVAIPRARPASMEWMLTHSEHSQRRILASRTEDAEKRAERPPVTVLPAAPQPVSGAAGDADAVADAAAAPPAPAAGGQPAAVPAPDPSYVYVFIDDMSPWVIRATLTAEDGDFFFYGGVNPVTLADAIAINIREGGIAFGASTISMQLVKMLFLDQARIFSRKLQEVFLVYLMEHEVPVPKDRILELYLNLAEFGPGIFGISDAAERYFRKHPRDLTAAEATWLASILPAPKASYRQYLEGRVSDASFKRMLELYALMLERGRMTEGEYEVALSGRPSFRAAP